MGNKKPAQTKAETTASPEAMAAYRDILSRATTAADRPYEAYTGDRVAGFSPDQMAAFQSTRDAQGMMTPYITEATDLARTAASPISAEAIARYQNPYQQSVIDATMRDLQTQNAIAQTQVTGNAALRGALGGSRVGVAQALTAGEQARAQAPVLANLYSSGYDKALQAAQQDRAAASSGASLMTGIGDAAHTGAYRDIASLYGMGQQQQGNTQAGLDAAYQQWLQQQAYPTQQISWLTDVASRAGGGMGSTTTSTAPAPNPMNAILGAVGTVAGAALGGPMGASIGGSLGSAAGGALGGGSKTTFADGGVVPSYAMGGVVKGYDDGGVVDMMPDSDGIYGLAGNDLVGSVTPDTTAMTMGGTGGEPVEGFASAPGGFNWQSLGNPLMTAGLKMMSSTSPYLGVAIGEGGLAGVKAYGDNAKAEADKKHKEEQLKLQRDRLGASVKAQREKLEQERWHPLGPSNDPAKPGYYFYDRNSGETVLRDMSVAPRSGAAGTARAGIERALANDLIEEAKKRGETIDLEEGIRRARTIGRERIDAEITRRDRIAQQAVVNGTYPDIKAARRAMGLPEDLPVLALPVRPSAPAAAPAAPAVIGTEPGTVTLTPTAPAPVAPVVTPPPTTFRDPYDKGPGSPPIRAPLPPPAAPGAVVPPAAVAPRAAAPVAAPPIMAAPPKKPDGSTYSRDELISMFNANVEKARAAGNTAQVNALMAQARAWGIVK